VFLGFPYRFKCAPAERSGSLLYRMRPLSCPRRGASPWGLKSWARAVSPCPQAGNHLSCLRSGANEPKFGYRFFMKKVKDLVGFVMREQLIAGLLRRKPESPSPSPDPWQEPEVPAPLPNSAKAFPPWRAEWQRTIEARTSRILVESRHRPSRRSKQRKLYYQTVSPMKPRGVPGGHVVRNVATSRF